MGKAEDIVKELLIGEIKLRNELLIKHFGGVAFESVDKKVAQRQITVEIPDFDPRSLSDHRWKGRKIGPDGEGKMQYEDGSATWGWNYENQFPAATIEVLKKGPITIADLEYSLDQDRHVVHKRKPK